MSFLRHAGAEVKLGCFSSYGVRRDHELVLSRCWTRSVVVMWSKCGKKIACGGGSSELFAPRSSAFVLIIKGSICSSAAQPQNKPRNIDTSNFEEENTRFDDVWWRLALATIQTAFESAQTQLKIGPFKTSNSMTCSPHMTHLQKI